MWCIRSRISVAARRAAPKYLPLTMPIQPSPVRLATVTCYEDIQEHHRLQITIPKWRARLQCGVYDHGSVWPHGELHTNHHLSGSGDHGCDRGLRLDLCVDNCKITMWCIRSPISVAVRAAPKYLPLTMPIQPSPVRPRRR